MTYECAGCRYRTAKWMGFCPQCRGGGLRTMADPAGGVPVALAEVDPAAAARIPTGMGEVDRVLGGGLVAGSAVLVGGEPGVGKSTLLLQVAAGVVAAGGTVLIASAEESAEQVALRSSRLGIEAGGVSLLAERDLDVIVAAAAESGPTVLVVDSIQTVVSEDAGVAGGAGQVRACASQLVQLAKEEGVTVVLVGHVTKDGSIAGPKLVEHAVDVVLYLEGEQDHGLRLLRGLKNRFGAAPVTGLFEMGGRGLTPLADPSAEMIGQWQGAVPGTVVFPTVEGKRPLLIEIQALVAAGGPQPRRSVRGIDPARLHQVLAVLERHAGLTFAGVDVYVNAVGGVRVREPAGDLPVALALASSLLERPLGPLAAWGEIGLTGEIRPAPLATRRSEEAHRLGVTTVVAPGSACGDRIEHALAAAGVAAA